jgi:ketosteroid isomerase-like protein
VLPSPPAMNKERARLIDRFYEALKRRDVDAVLDMCADDVEVYKDPAVVEMVAAFTPRGRDGVAQWLEEWLKSWDVYEPVVESVREMGDDIVALVRVRARGRRSQYEFEDPMADVITVRGDRIARLRLYVSRDQVPPASD